MCGRVLGPGERVEEHEEVVVTEEAPAAAVVTDNPGESRYEIQVGGRLAGFAEYRRGAGSVAFDHTETEPGSQGRGLASELIRRALDDVRGQGLTVQPFCPFVKVFIARHDEYKDLVAAGQGERFGPRPRQGRAGR